jgi:cell division protein FtsW (lipid II flippase)
MLRVYVKDFFTDEVEVVSAFFTVEIPKEPIDWTVTIVLVAVTAVAVVIIILWRHPKTAKKVKSLFSPRKFNKENAGYKIGF